MSTFTIGLAMLTFLVFIPYLLGCVTIYFDKGWKSKTISFIKDYEQLWKIGMMELFGILLIYIITMALGMLGESLLEIYNKMR